MTRKKKRPPRKVRYVNRVYDSARRRRCGREGRNPKSMDERGGRRRMERDMYIRDEKLY